MPSPRKPTRYPWPAQETLRLTLARDTLQSQNRKVLMPSVGLALGIASIVTGAALFALSNHGDATVSVGRYCSPDGDSCSTSTHHADLSNDGKWASGIALMSIGSAITLITAPLLALRVSRHRRLGRIERKLRWLQEHGSLGQNLQAHRMLWTYRLMF